MLQGNRDRLLGESFERGSGARVLRDGVVGLGPGVSARIAAGLPDPQEEWLLIAVAIGVTLALLGGTTLSLRRWRRGGRVVTGVTALLATVLSFGAVAIIRM